MTAIAKVRTDVTVPQPVPTHGNDRTSAGTAGEPIWNLPSGDPARGGTIGVGIHWPKAIGLAFTAATPVAIVGAILTGNHASKLSYAKEGPWVAATFGLGILAAGLGIAGIAMSSTSKGPYDAPLHVPDPKKNPNFNPAVANDVAAKSLVGHSLSQMQDVHISKVVSLETDLKAAERKLVTKDLIDEMLAGKSAGRALVGLPVTAFNDAPQTFAIVELANGKGEAYPAPPQSEADRGARGSDDFAIVSMESVKSDHVEYKGNERWNVTMATPTVTERLWRDDLGEYVDQVLGEAAATEAGRNFEGYSTS